MTAARIITGLLLGVLVMTAATGYIPPETHSWEYVVSQCEQNQSATLHLQEVHGGLLAGKVTRNGETVETVECRNIDDYSLAVSTTRTVGHFNAPLWTVIAALLLFTGLLGTAYRGGYWRRTLTAAAPTAAGTGLLAGLYARGTSSGVIFWLPVVGLATSLLYIYQTGRQRGDLLQGKTAVLVAAAVVAGLTIVAAYLVFVGIPLQMELQ